MISNNFIFVFNLKKLIERWPHPYLRLSDYFLEKSFVIKEKFELRKNLVFNSDIGLERLKIILLRKYFFNVIFDPIIVDVKLQLFKSFYA